MGKDYIVPLSALVFQATRRLSGAQSARQSSSSRAKGTGKWHMEISDSAHPVMLDGHASGKLEQKIDAMPNNTTSRHARRCWTALPASRVPAADALHKQGRGQLTQAPVCGPASLGVCLAGPQSSSCASSEQGDARAEAARKDGGVSAGVSGGADRLARSLARQADDYIKLLLRVRNGGRTSGTVVVSVCMGPVTGAALPAKLDGLQ